MTGDISQGSENLFPTQLYAIKKIFCQYRKKIQASMQSITFTLIFWYYTDSFQFNSQYVCNLRNMVLALIFGLKHGVTL